MRKVYKKGLAVLAVLTGCVLISGCGCGKKKAPDDDATRVRQITITPETTPTPAPDQISRKAISVNGDLTMVNLSLAEEKQDSAETAGETEGSETDGTETDSTETDGTEDGSEE